MKFMMNRLAAIALGLCATLGIYADETGTNTATDADCLNHFAEYDKIMLKRSQGPISETDSIAMIGHLKGALDDYRRAGEGGVSDEAAKAFGAHYNDYTVAGIFMFQDRDYKGAYDLWEACVELPDNPKVAAGITNMQNSRGQIAFNRAMAATQAGMNAEALASYEKAFELDYDDNQLFDSAIMSAEQARDYAMAAKWAQRGMDRMGQTSVYRDYMIKYVTMQDPAKGIELCTETIALDPQNPKWYSRRVEINERLKNHDAVLEDLKKITELSPNDPVVWYNYGAKKMFATNLLKNAKETKKDVLNAMYDEACAALEQSVKLADTSNQRTMPAVVKSLNELDKYFHQKGDKAGKKRVEEYRKKLGIRA